MIEENAALKARFSGWRRAGVGWGFILCGLENNNVKATDLDISTARFKCQGSRCDLLGFLKPHQVSMIDDALCSLGDYGEVRLLVEKGRLRFLVMQRSYDVTKLDSQALKDGIPVKDSG
jgi:hypothetical protein